MINTFWLKIRQSKHSLFIALWMAISVVFEYQKIVWMPPLTVHQGAQTDRASIALNYARVSMNFFEPRVMETGTRDGITPCEFPIINYTVAVFYKIFGYHAFWYRFLMWLVVGFGTWAVFDIFRNWLESATLALLLSFIWYFSSILDYYTVNYLPDAASMSFMMLALRCWYLDVLKPDRKKLLYYFILASLAALIKITALIFVIAILCIGVLKWFKNKSEYKILPISLAIIFLVFCWYYYCSWLEKQVGGSYFLMELKPAASWVQFKEWFKVFYYNWFYKMYAPVQWIVLLMGMLLLPFSQERKELKWFVILSFLGICAFYILMASQFQYHDYYVINFLPLMVFLFGFFVKFIQNKFPKIALVLVLVLFTVSMIEAKNNVRIRYTKGNHMYQTFFEPEGFNGMENWLVSKDIGPDKKVLAAFDANPNALLFFLKRRGYRTYDHNEEYIFRKLEQVDAMITNDTTQFFTLYPNVRDRIEQQSKLREWFLYKVK